MNRAIHFKSVEAFFRENYGIELDNRCYENKANGYTYRVFFEKGTDIGLFTTNEDEEVVCLDSFGKPVPKEKIFGYTNDHFVEHRNDELVISEQNLVLRVKDETVDIKGLFEREAQMYPERTPIVLNGMFTRNGYTSAITTFYVDEIVYANAEEFNEICATEDSEILKQYNEKTYEPITGGVHGILVIGPSGDGVMVDTAGHDYARYISYAPKIEMPVNYILEQNMKRDAVYEMKLYVPLKVTKYDEDFEEEEIDGELYMRTIREKVAEFNREDGERGLAKYYGRDNISRNKVYSIRPDVERVRDVIMGVAVIEMTKPLTEPEIDDLKDYLIGQFSDGWGESFEQREISTSDGNIYVHFWEGSDTYYIKTEEELKQDFEQGQGMQAMQGM